MQNIFESWESLLTLRSRSVQALHSSDSDGDY
jgi:hypothetical protein